MMLEFAASRLMAPWFGTSIFVWGNIIGVILIALTLGYYFGGRYADKHPHPAHLMRIVFWAGIFTSLVPAITHIIGSSVNLLYNFSSPSVVLNIVGSFFVIIILFAIPIGLLGTVSPFAIRIMTDSVKESGRVAGGLYAFSTLGSIVGTFASAFFLVPYVGSRETVLIASVLLLLVSIVGAPRQRYRYVALVLPFLSYWLVAILFQPVQASVLDARDSLYQYIQVEDQGNRLALVFNEGLGTQSYYMKNGGLTNSYFDYLTLLSNIAPQPVDANVLVLGLAGGTVTSLYNEFEPSYQLTGVEIDSEVIALARQYFGLDDQQVNVVNADARQFVQSTDQQFDIIIVDAYSNELYIPYHLTTQEFFRELKQRLRPAGVVSMNIGSINEHSQLVESILATLQTEFDHVAYIPVEQTLNFVVMASDAELSTVGLRTVHDARQSLAQYMTRAFTDAPVPSRGTVLTDNRAPIELYTEKMIFDYIRGATN